MFTAKAFKGFFPKNAPRELMEAPDMLMTVRRAGVQTKSDHFGRYSRVMEQLLDEADSGVTSKFLRNPNQFNASGPGFDTPLPRTFQGPINIDQPMSRVGDLLTERYGSVLEMSETELATTTRLQGVAEALAPLAEAEEVAIVGAESGVAASGGALAAAGPVLAGVAGVLLLVAGGYAIYKHFGADESPVPPVSVSAPLEVGPGPGFQRMDDRSGGWRMVHPEITRRWKNNKNISSRQFSSLL